MNLFLYSTFCFYVLLEGPVLLSMLQGLLGQPLRFMKSLGRRYHDTKGRAVDEQFKNEA